jgi:hypothetical protein
MTLVVSDKAAIYMQKNSVIVTLVFSGEEQSTGQLSFAPLNID